MQPRHRQRRRRAGALAHRRAPFGILREGDLIVARDARQHLGLDEVHVAIRDGVVLDRALSAGPGASSTATIGGRRFS